MTEAVVTSSAALTIGQPAWITPALVLFVIALVVLIIAYRRVGRASAGRTLAFACKLVALALIAACLLEPLWTRAVPKPDANVVVVLADDSRGMTLAEHLGGRTRGEALRALFADGGDQWLHTLDTDFDVRIYTVAAGMTRTLAPAKDLGFTGAASNLAAALREVSERYRTQALAGVIVLSDGAATDAAALKDLPVLPPVFTVPIGGDDLGADLALGPVTVTSANFEDAPVTIQTEVLARQAAGKRALVRLTEKDGKVIETQMITLDGADHRSAVRFTLKPSHQGVVFHALDVSFAGDEQAPPAEATQANNRRLFVVDRGRGPYRILYVSGRPNWEFKFLSRALVEDEQVNLVGLIRIAKREPKFEFDGRDTGRGNRLFSNTATQREDATYDKPVLVRLGVKDADELAGGFPKTPEELFAYHALVIDDLEAAFFTRDQQDLIKRFVAERGGGLLMLGGADSLEAGDYDRTPIGDVLPVYTRANTQASPDAGVRLELTREGQLQPWVRLRDQGDAESRRLAELPVFEVVNRVNHIKPGASLLATARTPSGEQLPALAAQRFGRGRALAFTIGDAWRSGLRPEAEKTADLGRFWRQTVRWLTAEVPGRVTLEITAADGPTRPTGLGVRVVDEAFQPLDHADIAVSVALPTGDAVALAAEPGTGAPGTFNTAYLAAAPGAYRVTATATTGGMPAAPAEAGFVVDHDAAEFARLTPDRALLADLSQRTTGRLVEAGALGSLAAELRQRQAPVMATSTTPLWHQPWVLLTIVALLVGEWILRRRGGLA